MPISSRSVCACGVRRRRAGHALQTVDDLLLGGHAEFDEFTRLGHVVGQLVITAGDRLAQGVVDTLQAVAQPAAGVHELADGHAKGLSQARHLDGATLQLPARLGQRRGSDVHLADEALAHLLQHGGGSREQGINRPALLGSGAVQGLQQGVE